MCVCVCVSILRIHAHRGCGHSSTNHSKWLLLLALSPFPLCTGPVPDQTAKHSFLTPSPSKASDVNAIHLTTHRSPCHHGRVLGAHSVLSETVVASWLLPVFARVSSLTSNWPLPQVTTRRGTTMGCVPVKGNKIILG